MTPLITRAQQKLNQTGYLLLAKVIIRHGSYSGLYRWFRRLIALLPESLRGSRYRMAKQNLSLWQDEDTECAKVAIRYTAVHVVRKAAMLAYHHMPIQQRKDFSDSLSLDDPEALLPRLHQQKVAIALLHTGDYWLTVFHIMRQYGPGQTFIIPRADVKNATQTASLQSLESLGHKVVIVDSTANGAGRTLYRWLARGAVMIIFVDLPHRVGGIAYGKTTATTLAGRAAQLIKGPAQVAAKFALPLLLAGSSLDGEGKNTLHIYQWIEARDERQMHAEMARIIDSALAASPENWLYLPVAESYFHYTKESSFIHFVG